MSELKISCLSIDCPERQGGICRYDPRTLPYGARKPHYNAFQQAWEQVEAIVAEFGDDPDNCFAILNEHVAATLYGAKEFER